MTEGAICFSTAASTSSPSSGAISGATTFCRRRGIWARLWPWRLRGEGRRRLHGVPRPRRPRGSACASRATWSSTRHRWGVDGHRRPRNRARFASTARSCLDGLPRQPLADDHDRGRAGHAGIAPRIRHRSRPSHHQASRATQPRRPAVRLGVPGCSLPRFGSISRGSMHTSRCRRAAARQSKRRKQWRQTRPM